jgi:hypothetical protein
MPFKLKNTRAICQRAMVTMFYNMMHKDIEVYMDDMTAKSREGKMLIRSKIQKAAMIYGE